MALVLTCDGCGTTISPDDLRSSRAVELGGYHFCERCKPASAAAAAPGRARPGLEPARDPLDALEDLPDAPLSEERPSHEDLEIGSDLDAELEALAAAPPPPPPRPAQPRAGPAAAKPGLPGKAPLPARPNRPAAPPAAPPAAARAAPRAGPPPGRKPAPAAAGPLKQAGRPAAAGRPAPPQGAARPATRPVLPPQGARARPGRPTRPGVRPAPAARGAAAPEAAPAEGKARSRRKVLIIGGSATAVMVAAVALVAAFHGGSQPAPPPKEAQPPVAALPASGAADKTAAETVRIIREAGAKKLEAFRGRLGGGAEELIALRAEMDGFLPPQELEEEARKLGEQVDLLIQGFADKAIALVKAQADAYLKEDKFEAASELWKQMPELVRKSEVRGRWLQEELKAENYARAWGQWRKIDAKADKYLTQGDDEIAKEILRCEDNLPPNCQARFPEIWARRERRIQALEADAAGERLARQERELERRHAEEA